MTGQNKITGLRRRDKLQGHLHYTNVMNSSNNGGTPGAIPGFGGGTLYSTVITGDPITDGTNGTPRIGVKTEMESATAMMYLYVGSYSA